MSGGLCKTKAEPVAVAAYARIAAHIGHKP